MHGTYPTVCDGTGLRSTRLHVLFLGPISQHPMSKSADILITGASLATCAFMCRPSVA